ncbi:D-sedoheptulose-7-phosphate isomerase [Blautia sp. HCP3S3_G3]|uniref:D-sedoheptulose-7-phosphate isomerase n=1 Tax=Blautia sp. HCP3S3_G3 TaxID=3438913 RepID=UPI003F8A2490
MKTEQEYLREMNDRHPDLAGVSKDVETAYEILKRSYCANGKLLTCGNGGSASDADHIVGELMKGFHLDRPLGSDQGSQFGELTGSLQGALPAISLTQNHVLATAYANDVNPDMIFAQQVYGYGCEGDVLIALTTSGNSKNVLYAAEVARKKKMHVIGFTGETGGMLKEMSDVCICVPETETAFVQEKHIIVYHTICSMLEAFFFGQD